MISATSSTEVLIRVVTAIAFAVVALILATKAKPATPGDAAVVRVERRPTPLYRPPVANERWKSLGRLGGGALLGGAVLACLLGFAVAIALGLVDGLLR